MKPLTAPQQAAMALTSFLDWYDADRFTKPSDVTVAYARTALRALGYTQVIRNALPVRLSPEGPQFLTCSGQSNGPLQWGIWSKAAPTWWRYKSTFASHEAAQWRADQLNASATPIEPPIPS